MSSSTFNFPQLKLDATISKFESLFNSHMKKGDDAANRPPGANMPPGKSSLLAHPLPDDDRLDKLNYKDLYPHHTSGYALTRDFLLRVSDILIEYVRRQNDRSTKILDFHQPEDLKRFLNLEIPDEPQSLEQLLADCKETLKYQVKTAHPRFFNQLSTGLDVVCMAGEWLTATANTNMFTYEIAPVFILMELTILEKMREIVGFKSGDGILCPGGSISNMYAAMLARFDYDPTIKERGLHHLPQLVLMTSEHSHYSMQGAASTMGIGTENVVCVKCDDRGKMLVSELEREIEEAKAQGKVPFFVNATAGTTVYGAYDPIDEIADVCERYGIWMHVDAAWGGGALLSSRLRHMMSGVHRANSITWNPHKLMGCLLQCSVLLIREKTDILIRCNSMCADYLFQQDKHYDPHYDTGDKVIQCGRHNDIFKLFLMWRSKGMRGYEEHMNKLWDMTRYLADQIKKREGFELILEPECTNVCFFYVPPRLRGMEHGQDRYVQLGRIAPRIKERMMKAGTLMVGYQPLGKLPNFWRSIISNVGSTYSDIDFQLDEIERLGVDL